MQRALKGTIALSILCAGLLGRGIASQAATSSDQAVAYQINTAHSGDLGGDALAPPLTKRWSRDLGGQVSYPLIAGGRVYVTVANVGSYGSTLYALDAATGNTLWSQALGGTYYFSAAAYDNGQVFALNYDGLLRSFDASTGAQHWSVQLPGQSAFTSPPVASNGVVYTGGAGSGGTLYAVGETTGAVSWSQPVVNGDHSSPALSGNDVYVSYSCPNVFAFDRTSGASLWSSTPSCSGGGGRTAVLNGTSLYVRDLISSPPGYVLNSANGAGLGRFAAGPAPAFAGTTGLFLSGSTLTAQNTGTGAILWTFAGDGSLDTAPIVVNGDVYVGSSSGNLYALDLGTGNQVWSANAGASIRAPDENNAVQLTGLGAGEGYLVVPAGTHLTAFTTTAPVVTGTSFSATEGSSFSGVVANFTDGSPSAASDTATIGWGDGNTSSGTVASNGTGSFTVTGSHTYAEEGSYAASVTVTGSGGSSTATSTATVSDASLSSQGYALSVRAKATFSGRVATAVDSDPGCARGDYAATISWGDGASTVGTLAAGSAACSFDVSGSHAYAHAGTYTVTTRVSDSGGATTAAASTMSVHH